MTQPEDVEVRRARAARIQRRILWAGAVAVLIIAAGVGLAIYNTSGERSCRQKTTDAGLSIGSTEGQRYEQLCLQQQGKTR